MAASTPSRLPIGLFDDVDEAEEALFLTYSANLDFFERAVLQRTRGLQARATVISDSAMVSSDPVAVRHAGLKYLDARAVSPRGAFHPKVIVVAGPEAVTLAVGSGNLTLAGWHGNSELWTVIRGDGQSVPGTFAQAAGFLRGLSDSEVILSPGAGDAMERAALLLERGTATYQGPRMVSSLGQPIIDQMPRGPVDELIAYAPFHDSRIQALEALVDRLAPSALTVFVAPDTTVDGARLEGYLAARGGRLAWTLERPHHHGKIISWRIGEQWWALTGSPNLSAPALLSTVADGNCEVGLIGEIEGPLSPQETDQPIRGVAGLRGPEPSRESQVRSLLLAAVAAPGGTVLHLAGPLEESALIEVFDEEAGAFIIDDAREVPAGCLNHTTRPPLPPGAALQLVLQGAQTRSNRVYVTDMGAATRRPVRVVGTAMTTATRLVLGDAFEQLLADIDALRPYLLRMQLIEPAPASSAAQAESEAATTGDQPVMRRARRRTLEEHLDGLIAVLGDPLTRWALSLPQVPGEEGETKLSSVELTAETGDEMEDPPENVVVEDLPLPEVIDTLTELQRNRLRRWIHRLLVRAAGAPPIVRVLAARLVLHGIAAKLWPSHEEGAVVLEAIEVLSAPGDEPVPAERVAAASLAAVLLSLLHAEAPRRAFGSAQMLRFERGERLARVLLEHCSTEDLTRLCDEMRPRLGIAVSAAVVLEVALEATNPEQQGYGRAIEILERDYGIIAQERNGGLELYKELPRQPEYFLILAVAVAERDVDPVIVRGRTDRGPVLAVWRAPWLAISHTRRTGQRGELYRLTAGSEPRSLISGRDPLGALPPKVEQWMPGQTPDGVGAVLLALADMDAESTD
ncbi:phospholipase D family protein [Miltoncostaea oceani]|uniref:phospholipase D family protein n=1 Tax=Miltoncostaea oceani TaxID=2843216 RepID=UPI001C3D68C4|nr:phospholipase D family protein [Miltoncostaea oceani]